MNTHFNNFKKLGFYIWRCFLMIKGILTVFHKSEIQILLFLNYSTIFQIKIVQ
jgi:hypothetical protein